MKKYVFVMACLFSVIAYSAQHEDYGRMSERDIAEWESLNWLGKIKLMSTYGIVLPCNHALQEKRDLGFVKTVARKSPAREICQLCNGQVAMCRDCAK